VYLESILVAGGAPLAIPIGLDKESLRTVYDVLDGVLLPGGDDVGPERYGQQRHPLLGNVDPLRDDLELTVARWALEDDLPLLGICRGIQVLAVAAGGTLWQDIPSQFKSPLAHDVREFGFDHLSHSLQVVPGTHLARSIRESEPRVNSLHHQAVCEVPPGFMITASSNDGVVEGIEGLEYRFAVGVQCHPERMWQSTAPEFRGLFEAFVTEAATHRSGTHQRTA
ncbi:MAG: gamma-glutamyl-gamma-aminobutyrate hydrolase family protein, partial [Chloroflexota bacterium]